MKQALVLLLLIIASCTLFGQDNDELQTPPVVEQWAISAKASNAAGGLLSQYTDDQGPYAATGQPDVEQCVDDLKAWTVQDDNMGMQWIELSYEKEVYVSKIRIHETLGVGAVAKVELLNDGDYVVLWEGIDKNKQCPGYFEIGYEERLGNITKSMTPYKTDKMKITLDTDAPGWNEIDAVQLIGYEQRWFIYNNTLMTE